MATTFFLSLRTSSLLLRLFILSAVVVDVCLSYKQQYYQQHRYPSSPVDNFNIDSVLNNSRVVNAYLKCLLGTGPCTKEGRDMKRMLPELLRTACSKCNPVEKERLTTFLRRVQGDPKLHDAWQKVLDQYDPQRQYQPLLERFTAANRPTVVKPQTPF